MNAQIRDISPMDRPIERRPRRARLLWMGAAAVALIALVWAGRPLVSRWAAAGPSVAADRLRFATVVRGDLVHDIAAQGRVVAASRPTLYSPAAGIVSMRAREGTRVEAGQLLAVVSSPELESRLRQEQATLLALESDRGRMELSARQQNLANEQRVALAEVERRAAEREGERAERLAGLGLVNQIELERARDGIAIRTLELEQARQRVGNEREMLDFQVQDARSRVERQRLVVRDSERQVKELEVLAPFAGLIATVSVEDADAVVRGQALVGVVDLSDLEVEVSIPESFADDVAPGLTAWVRVEGREVEGTLTRVAPEVRDSQVAGRIAFSGGPPEGLRQNQRLSARVLIDRRRGVLKVPRGPFYESGGGRLAYVVADGVARRRAVTLGAVSVTEIEVLDGLAEGEEVVLSDLGAFEGAETLLIRK